MKKILFIACSLSMLNLSAQIYGSGTAGCIPRFTGATSIGNSLFFQTTGNQIGLGIGTPAARMEIRNGCSFSPLDALNITNETNCVFSSTAGFLTLRGYNVSSSTYTTRFVIDANVKTGVNVASPEAQLDVQPYTSSVNPLLLHSNTGTSIFTVLNTSNVGINVPSPVAQLDVQPYSSSVNPLLLHNNTGTSIFTVLNAGNVGIGVSDPDASSSILAVKAQGTNPTYLDLFETSTSVANNAMLRFIGSTGSLRHFITEDANGNLLIDAGYDGIAANKVKIDGSVQITEVMSIGTDAPSLTASTLAIKRASTTEGPSFDIYQDDAVTGWNGQIRFIRNYTSGGTSYAVVRHVIADDYDNGNMIIHPGIGGGATNVLQINGNVQIGTIKPTLSTYINSTSGESNISVNGWLVAKKVMVETSDWSDKVFGADYSLKSIPDLENYIKQNKHLPEIPSECEVLEKGVDVGEMNKLLLQKVEELTLYVIAQQKQIDNLGKK